MKLFRSEEDILVEVHGEVFPVAAADWDELLNSPALLDRVHAAARGTPLVLNQASLLAPIGTQEVWAAGVTYFRSRDARMEESKAAGGGDFYDRVYAAERPELFFKSAGWRAIGTGGNVRIRSDARWSIPEPELVLVANSRGQLVGVTIGNDMSSRDIEGENPLYLPQAKVYNGSCALGPGVLLVDAVPDPSTGIHLEIIRGEDTVVRGQTTLAELKRDPEELLSYLFRELAFPVGAYLMTGTGVVPPTDFTLAEGDRIRIAIDGIGVLENTVKS